MKFGFTTTYKGHVACLLEEDGTPLAVASRPFRTEASARLAARILQAAQENPLAAAVAAALRHYSVLQHLSVGGKA